MGRNLTQLRSSLSKYVPNSIKHTKRAMHSKFRLRHYRKRYDLPFDMPFSGISIETRTDCNLKCKFCPQSTSPRTRLVMTEDIFKKIIDGLAEIHFAGRICPGINNEPLLDDRIVSFIGYARQKCPLSFLELISNGTLLDEELLLELFAAGLDSLIVNDYRKDRQEHPYRLSKNHDRIAQISKTMFRKKIRITLRSTDETLGTRAGNIIREKKTALSLKRFCALPFTRMWIQPEGKVVLCCEDYSYDEIMGDVKENSLSEIWFSDKYKRIRNEIYKGDRKAKICEKCEYSGFPLLGER